MVTQKIPFLYAFLIAMFVFRYSEINADLSHICAYSNESVVKFRKSMLGKDKKEALKICSDEKISQKYAPHFEWPVDLCDFWISSLFGPRKYKGVTKMHHGIDLASFKGTAVKAAAEGKVILVQKDMPGYGTLVEIQHNKGFRTRYGHMEEILVQEGDVVGQQDLIGTVGSHGNVRAQKDPSHLHFEILQYDQGNYKTVNPLKYLYCSEILFVNQ